MKPMFAGFAGMIVIAIAAWATLGELGFSSADVFSGANVRLD